MFADTTCTTCTRKSRTGSGTCTGTDTRKLFAGTYRCTYNHRYMHTCRHIGKDEVSTLAVCMRACIGLRALPRRGPKTIAVGGEDAQVSEQVQAVAQQNPADRSITILTQIRMIHLVAVLVLHHTHEEVDQPEEEVAVEGWQVKWQHTRLLLCACTEKMGAKWTVAVVGAGEGGGAAYGWCSCRGDPLGEGRGASLGYRCTSAACIQRRTQTQ
jgi:hypothetical protein